MHANKIIDVFKEKNIPVECVNLGDDGLNIYVDSEFYEKTCLVARDIEDEYCTYLKITQKCPKLVNAEVGDFVGIFNKYDVGIKDVGIVTSKRKTDKGFSYGCRYIMPVIDESIKTSRVKYGSDFHLTDENYGGFHQGFLAVIPHEEMMLILQKEIDKQYDSALKKQK